MDAAALLRWTSERRLRTAVSSGRVRRAARGRYVLPDLDVATAVAARLGGAVALRSAALAHGWSVKWVPPVPEVAVDVHRHLARSRGVRLLWVRDHDPRRLVTEPLSTVVSCARLLPFDEALCVADSALRTRAVTSEQLRRAAEAARGAGAARVRRVAVEADGRAANPFESVLRSILIDLQVPCVPQHPVDVGERLVHPDLTDVRHRLVVEADSWEWHTGKRAHVRDCWRYNALVAHGWRVLRFTWEQVMWQPEYVGEVVLMTIGHRPAGQGEVVLQPRPSA